MFWQLSKGFQTLGSHLTPMLGDNGLLERQITIGMKFSKKKKKGFGI